MADTTQVAARAAKAPTGADIERAAEFVREPFLLDGEKPADLAPGTPRRRALDAALAEIEAGRETPSIEWRRDYSLLVGLERLLDEEPPVLKDGAELNPHQVDALSGTLAALISDLEANGEAVAARNGNGTANGAAAAAAVEDPAAETGEEVEAELDAADETGDVEDDDELAPDEEPQDWDEAEEEEELASEEVLSDPGASRRFWFEHATGAGKTVAAVGFVEASRTGGILILTHRRNLVDQFIGEISDRGYKDRLSPPLLDGADNPYGPVTVETYQWFVRNAGRISDAYSIVICDEAHTALGEKTSGCIRAWTGPIFIGMTATGALIARHVADLFPTQTSRFDLAQAARRGVIAPLRCIRIPPGPGVRTIAKVPLRKGEVDQDFDQEELAKLLDQAPFNVAIADLYKSRFRKVPGVIYTAGVNHANNVAAAFRDAGINARAVSGETPKRELAEILAGFERGEVDVLCNAMLLAEGWNSPRATICMHLAPTASRRVYQQRVGRVTRRHPGKEAGLVLDFVHPATTHDETVITLHSLLDRDVYRGGAIVVGPVRRGRGRRVRVEKRVVPVSGDSNRRLQVLERELWRIAVENLDHSEQHVWAALAGARVNPSGWRRAKAMLQHDNTKELRRRFLLTCIQRNRNSQLRIKALQEIAALRDPEAFDDAIDTVGTWPRDDRRAGTRVLLEALAERRIGRRDQAQAWVWRLAGYTRELHEEYAVQRWPETKRLLGLLVNSSGRAHGRNARRLVHAARNQDRRLASALLAAAVAHTPEGEEVLRGARMRAARKPSAVARELLRNFPKAGSRRRRRKRKGGGGRNGGGENGGSQNGAKAKANGKVADDEALESPNGAHPEAEAEEPDGVDEPDAADDPTDPGADDPGEDLDEPDDTEDPDEPDLDEELEPAEEA
jgi:ribonuclease E